MFNTIVVGIHQAGSDRDAITLATHLLEDQGHLTLAHIYPGDGRLWHGSSREYELLERERTLELLQKARRHAHVEANLRWREAPSPGQGLHELCELVGADLLVVGSSRRGLLGRAMIGDDTRSALNGAPSAIAIAPIGYAEQTVAMREIGVGYNGSVESRHALEVARELAVQHGSKVSAFEAVSLPAYAFSAGAAPIDAIVEELVADARARIDKLGDVEPHAVYGNAAEELALYSASLDLLVLGSRDYGPVGRLVHGSTSHRLARSARCPLLILTRAARAASPGNGSPRNRSSERELSKR